MVVLVGGVAIKNNRQLLNDRWDKNDDKDAANVADLIAQGKCLFYEYPLMTLREEIPRKWPLPMFPPSTII